MGVSSAFMMACPASCPRVSMMGAQEGSFTVGAVEPGVLGPRSWGPGGGAESQAAPPATHEASRVARMPGRGDFSACVTAGSIYARPDKALGGCCWAAQTSGDGPAPGVLSCKATCRHQPSGLGE